MVAATNQSAGGGESSRLDRYKDMIKWEETAIAGVGAWIAGLVVTLLILMISGVTDEMHDDTSILDAGTAVFYESIGGALEPDGGEVETLLQSTAGSYALLDTDWWGAALAVHGLVPFIILLIAGYFLAGRHLSDGTARTPLEGVIAGTSLSVVFAVTFTIALLVFTPDGLSANIAQAFLIALMYSLVFAALGATLRSAAPVRSLWGFLGGLGAFVGAFGLWYLVDDPFDDIQGADSFSDLDDSVEYFNFFAEFIGEHGLEEGALLPEWYVMLVALAVGAGIAYKYEVTDPLSGMGHGARLGVGYVLPVFIILLAHTGTTVRDINDRIEGDWPDLIISQINIMIGTLPLSLVLAGVVYPVVFAAIGGAVGAKVVESQQDDVAGGAQQGGYHQGGTSQTGQPPQNQPPQGGHQGQQAGGQHGAVQGAQQGHGAQGGHGNQPGAQQPPQGGQGGHEQPDTGGQDDEEIYHDPDDSDPAADDHR